MVNAGKQFSWLVVAQPFKSLQLICQSSQGSTRAGGGIIWLLAGLSSLLTVGDRPPCLITLASFWLGEDVWVSSWLGNWLFSPRVSHHRERKYSRQKPHSLLEPNLRGDIWLFLFYAVGHRDQPWYNMKGCHWRPSWRLATTECLFRCLFSMICSSYLMFKWIFYCL